MNSKIADRTGRRERAVPGTRRSVASAGARAERGQTTLDFALGSSLFLLALLGVLLFMSGTMEPFAEGSQEDIGVADRVADNLAEGLLAEPANPHVLNATCTAEFFDDASPSYCRHTGDNVTARVGVKNWQYVNVTIQSNVTGDAAEETLCWDRTDERAVDRAASECDPTAPDNDVVLTAGSTPPAGVGDTVTARRVVAINGTDATMLVEVW